jgi:hypothetical protein
MNLRTYPEYFLCKSSLKKAKLINGTTLLEKSGKNAKKNVF